MGKLNIRGKRYYKYKVVEMEYISMTSGEDGTKVEVCKILHKTNSKLLFYLIILCLKIQGIRYEVVD